MSSSISQSALSSTGAQTPVDRLQRSLSDIIRMDNVEEPPEESSAFESYPDRPVDPDDPELGMDIDSPEGDQVNEKRDPEGNPRGKSTPVGNPNGSLDGESEPEDSTPKAKFDKTVKPNSELGDPFKPSTTIGIDEKQGRRMSELRKNVVKFSGAPGEDVEEWLDKLDMIAGPEGFNLDYHDQALLLRLSVSGDAYQAVLMVRPGDPKTDPQQKGYLARVRSELRKRFGRSPDQAINQLCDTSFNNFSTVDEYATTINRLVRQTCPNTHRTCQGEWKKIFFYRGLPHNLPASSSIKPFCLDPTLSFEQVLEKARLYFDSNSDARVAAPGVRRSIGKGGKGRGKGKGKGRRGNHYFTQADPGKDKVHCDFCHRHNHTVENCRDLARAKMLLKVSKLGNRFTPVSSSVPLLVESEYGFTCLVDSGSSDTIISQTALERIYGNAISNTRHSVVISTIKGPQLCEVHKIPSFVLSCNFCENEHLEVLVVEADHVLDVGDRVIDVILGCDWIKRHSPVIIKKDQDSNHLVVVPNSQSTIPHAATAVATHDDQTSATSDGLKETAVIDDTDFRAVRLTKPDGTSRWRVQWKWISKVPPPRVFRPAIYEKQLQSLTTAQRELWRKELKNWEDQGFIEEVPRYELNGTLTLMAAVQEHKASTPCRPVIDFKPLNNQIYSLPNSDDHVTCQDTIRRWRAGRAADGHAIGKWVLIDIRKAYLCIEMDRNCANYQGLMIQGPNGETRYMRLNRLGFGVNIAPKVLRLIIKYILKENNLEDSIELFVDDIRVPVEYIEKVVSVLNQNGFPTKDPEESESARILGLQRCGTNEWKRREDVKPIGGNSYKDLRSWVATIASSHFPVLGWLCPAARALERLGVLNNPSAHSNDLLDESLMNKADKLYADIQAMGDPAKGTFMVNPEAPWVLYTDASADAIGACLYFGGDLVEDKSWLRAVKDIRPIDTVELEAALKGLNNVVVPWLRALNIKEGKKLLVYVDNKPVLGQLTRKQSKHWVSSKGLASGAAEVRLQMIDDLIALYKVDVSYRYIKSEENPADKLSRIPNYLRWTKPARRSPKVLAAGARQETWREASECKDGALFVPPQYIYQFVVENHDHEGTEALYQRLHTWVRAKGLRKVCKEVVDQCDECKRAKAHPNQNTDGIDQVTGKKRKRTPEEIRAVRKSVIPFNKVHIDVVGNYRTVSGRKAFFAVTLVDSATGYALVKATKWTPVSEDVEALFAYMFDTFHTTPLAVWSDSGRNLVSKRVENFLLKHNVLHLTTAKNTSLTNGKVERFHRTLNEYLRTHASHDEIGWPEFSRLVREGVAKYNTTPFRGVSSHDKVFRFSPQCEPLRPVETRDEWDLLCNPNISDWGKGLEPGTKVLYRNPRPNNKLTDRWLDATVESRVGPKTYKLEDQPGKFDLKDIKLLATSTTK